MNKRELAGKVAARLGVPHRFAQQLVDAVVDEVTNALCGRDGTVYIKGFGTFRRRIRKGRTYRHPITGDGCPVADREMVTFKSHLPCLLDVERALAGGSE